MVRVFTNGVGDCGSIPGRVLPKTQKMVLDAALINTQHYKVCIKGKVEQSKEWSCALPYTFVDVAIENGGFGSPSTKVTNFALIYLCSQKFEPLKSGNYWNFIKSLVLKQKKRKFLLKEICTQNSGDNISFKIVFCFRCFLSYFTEIHISCFIPFSYMGIWT